MEFAYYICDNGTKEDRKKDFDNMLKLIDMGYLGFISLPGITTMYRSFSIGIPQPQHQKEEYRFACRGASQTC